MANAESFILKVVLLGGKLSWVIFEQTNFILFQENIIIFLMR
jgi:hypothetical protein